MTSEPARPVLKVVRGDATPEEVAALLAVVRAAAGGDGPPEPLRRNEWGSPRRAVRAGVMPSRDGWRASAFPG